MRSLLTLAAPSLLVFAGLAHASPEFRVVARNTDVLPGMPDGAVLRDVTAPVIGQNGQVAFRASYFANLGGVTNATNTALFVEDSGLPQFIVRSGIEDPRFSDRSWFSLNTYRVLDSGDVGFLVRFDNVNGITSANDSFLYTFTTPNNTMQQVAGRGEAAPEITEANAVFSNTGFSANAVSDFGIQNPKGSTDGRVAFYAGLTGEDIDSSNNHGIWAGLPGDLRLIARKGDDDNDSGAGVIFNTVLLQTPLVNTSGEVLFSGLLSGPGITTQNDARVWLQSGSQKRTIWAEDDIAIEEDGVTLRFDSIEAINTGYRLNSNGNVLLTSRLKGPGLNSQNWGSLWVDRGEGLLLLARAGTEAPGGGMYELFLSDTMSMNDHARVAFAARLTGATFSTDTGVYIQGDGDQLVLAARENDPAPGVFSGSPVFDDFQNFRPLLLKNNLGQTAMLARLRGTGVSSTNNQALYIIESDGTLTLIARTSEFFNLSGDPSAPQNAQMTGIVVAGQNSSSGLPLAFNDRGELVFQLNLSSNRSAIVVASTQSIEPEPCFGDVTGDRAVDLDDLNLVLTSFGQQTSSGDANGDGSVNLDDLNIVLTAFGTSCP